MKTLLLVRHATAAVGPGLADEDRPLTAAGRAEARAVGRRLAGLGLVPGTALVSPARRARETYAGLAEAWASPPEPFVEPAIYEGSAGDLLDEVRGLGFDEAATTVLVGHNPAVGELARLCARQGKSGAWPTILAGFEPATVAVIVFETAAWAGVRPQRATLRAVLRP